MAQQSSSSSMYLFYLLFATCILAIKADYDPTKVYTIRPAHPALRNFALDTVDPSKVQLQEYRYRRAYELFHIEYSSQPGLFQIISEPTRQALDVDANTYPNAVILATRNSWSRSQLWYLENNGRIVNADKKLVLDVTGNRFEPGNPIIVYPSNGQRNQNFIIVEEDLSAHNKSFIKV